MAFVVKIFKTVRNHWKKTVFFCGLSAYGVYYANGIYEDSLIRKAYCEKAKSYGELPLRTGETARKVTVFLNPAAQKGKAKKLFDKNVAPILHLAGLEVTIVRTEYEGQAKQYMDVLDSTNAIVVAGGDGTLTEVVTGLLRRKDEETFSRIPLGIIPLGYTNTLAKSLFTKDKSDAKWMLDAALSVVQGATHPIDIIGISGDEGKTVYAASSFEWGAFKEAQVRAKKYWYFGPLKHRWSYSMSAIGSWPPVIQGKLSYIYPCEGCSKCYTPPPKPQWKWWHIFLPPKQELPQKDYSDVINDECGKQHEEALISLEFNASTFNCDMDNLKENRGIQILQGPASMDKMAFIKEGCQRIKGDRTPELCQKKEVKEFTLVPEGTQSHGSYMIDNDQFEKMPVTVKHMKNKLQVFCSLPS